MKVFAIACVACVVASPAFAQYRQPQTQGTGSNPQDHAVSGYTRQDGTYVQPYRATNPDNSKSNNYGAPGNQNPNQQRGPGFGRY